MQAQQSKEEEGKWNGVNESEQKIDSNGWTIILGALVWLEGNFTDYIEVDF